MSDTVPASARPLESFPSSGDARADALRQLLSIVDRLRAPDGCPWDREQTVESMAPSLIEEGYELLEAIERGDDAGAVEEAGDLLMVVALICRIAEQGGRFDLARAGQAVCEKLVRRHPHVFGDVVVESAGHAIENWERLKEGERKEKRTDASALAGVPLALPALQRAHRIGAKAIAAGFRWTGPEGALAKLREEVGELAGAMEALAGARESAAARARVEAELGDVLLAAAQLANYLELEPERAAREALRRFESRFRSMEAELGGSVRGVELGVLMAAWQSAKARETSPPLATE